MALDRDKLARVLRLLESNQDGEVLAAVAAMQRMLQAAGMKISDLAGGSAVDQAAYQLMRTSMDAERRTLDRMREQLTRERAVFEQERDMFYASEAYRDGKTKNVIDTSPNPDDTLTLEKLREAMRKAGIDGSNAYADPFAPYRANEYNLYRERPNYEQQTYYEEEQEKDGTTDKYGWTEKTAWDDANRTKGLHDGATELWEKWAKVDVARAGWILGHRYTNQVAQQAFAFVCKHGRLHRMMESTIDVYMRRR